MPASNGTTPRYQVIVHAVKEVSLHGSADLGYWRTYLAREGLAPLDVGGRAELLLIAADMVWLGVRFTELSVSVALAPAGAPDQRAGMYLIQAFNSVRWFAWVERTLFQTPYYPARTQVSVQSPVSITLHDGAAEVLSARLAPATVPASRGPGRSAGPVYLPSALTQTRQSEKLFFAELSGETEIYPAAPGDQLRLAPSPRTPVVQWLQESGFASTAWHVRPTATHKKSQTQRAQAQPAALERAEG